MNGFLQRRDLLCLLLTAGALQACGGNQAEPLTPPPPQPATPPPPPPPPRDADQRARKVVNAKLGALIHMARVKPHPLAPQLAAMDPWGPLFRAAGIDPLVDVERAFVASANARTKQAAIVIAEHTLDGTRLQQAMATMVQQSGEDGALLSDYPVPAARIMVNKRVSVALAVTPSLLAITSERYARAALQLMGTGGLPGPIANEAISGDAIHPATSLDAPRVPPLPPTLQHGWATVVLLPSGDADLALDGISTDAAQAKLDADELSRITDEATMVKISILRVRVAQPIDFRSQGNHVKGDRRVTLGELQLLMGQLSSQLG